MFPGTTKKGGQAFAFPDVCKIPAPPAPFVPAPYPNIALEQNLKKANKADAQAKNGNKTAMKKVIKANISLNNAMGDEAGTLKGLISQKNMDKVKYGGPGGNLKFEGKKLRSATECVLMGKTIHNGGGCQLAPSQVKVIVAP